MGFSVRKGTVRGMHFQIEPVVEAKLVRCTRGAMFDVALDMRPDSPSYGQWFGAELSAENGRMLYVPNIARTVTKLLRRCNRDAVHDLAGIHTQRMQRRPF